MEPRRTVALALGSGGARGYAHIGVLDALHDRGFDVVAVAGSSMGAIVGGAFAAGKLEEYRNWVTGIGQFELLRLMDIALSQPGALRGERLFAKIHGLVGDVCIEDLPVKFTAVAVDLLTRREVWFQRGPLEDAMRASGALPSIFPPVESKGRLLIDGGILNPLPLAPTAATSVDLVVAVSLHGDPIPPTDAVDDDVALVDRIRALASRAVELDLRALLRPWSRHDIEPLPTVHPEAEEPPLRRNTRAALGKFDMVNLSIETMQAALIEHKLAGYRPDVLITIPRNACRTLDFHRATELIDLGRAFADDALDAVPRPRQTPPPPA